MLVPGEEEEREGGSDITACCSGTWAALRRASGEARPLSWAPSSPGRDRQTFFVKNDRMVNVVRTQRHRHVAKLQSAVSLARQFYRVSVESHGSHIVRVSEEVMEDYLQHAISLPLEEPTVAARQTAGGERRLCV